VINVWRNEVRLLVSEIGPKINFKEARIPLKANPTSISFEQFEEWEMFVAFEHRPIRRTHYVGSVLN